MIEVILEEEKSRQGPATTRSLFSGGQPLHVESDKPVSLYAFGSIMGELCGVAAALEPEVTRGFGTLFF
jgi:hypothetical protein